MQHASSKIVSLAVGCASRLRLLQMQLAGKDVTVRSDYLSEEVERALKELSPGDRDVFLRELGALFPDWAGAGEPRSPVSVEVAEAPLAALGPPELLARLLQLEPAELEDILNQVLESGPVSLQPAAAAPAESGRAVRATEILLRFVDTIEPLIRTAWSSLSGEKNQTRRHELQEKVEKFLAGDDNVDDMELTGELEQLRRLSAALIGIIQHAGRQTAQMIVREWAPDNIQLMAKTEGKSALVSWDVAYWRKFKQMAAQSLTEDTVEQEINRRLASYVTDLLRAAGG